MGCSGSKVVVVTYNLFWWCVSNEYKTCPQFKDDKGFQGLYKTIQAQQPLDLVGFQECEDVTRVLYGANLTNFDFFAPQGDAPMAWSADRFQKLGEGGSVQVAKDKYGGRFINYVRLMDKRSKEVVFFANTHGPLGQCALPDGAEVAANYLEVIHRFQKPGDRVIFTGDFNCASGDPTLQHLGKELQSSASDFSFGGADHILTGKNLKTCASETAQGFPSDHQILKLSVSVNKHDEDAEVMPALPLPDIPAAPAPAAVKEPAVTVPQTAPEPAPVKVSDNCPKPGEPSPCCVNCATPFYCPDNKGCYLEGSSGCPGALCPLSPHDIHS